MQMEQCIKCQGTGLIKVTPQICSHCDGYKCIQCNSTGLSIQPYIDCQLCDRTGTIITFTSSLKK